MKQILNQKGLAHILFIFILLLGIIAGVYLSQKTQIFKPRASEGVSPKTPQTVSFEIEQFYLNEGKIAKLGGNHFGANSNIGERNYIQNSYKASTGETYTVDPYIIYPADKPMYPEYEGSVNNFLSELQKYYKTKVGVTFKLNPLQVIRSPLDYLTMRCGEQPDQECVDDPKIIRQQWMWIDGLYSATSPETRIVKIVFGVGGGGFAGGPTNYAIAGDWVLEPLSGRPNDWGIPCKYSDGWQCDLNTAKGTVAHELGHSFGIIDHPPAELDSIMNKHWDYPHVGFLDYEIKFLNASPFFKL